VGTGPLSGVKVLDLSIVWAGPYAGLHLADLGADVIKIEGPDGDPWRNSAAVIPGNGKVFQFLNRGKRGIVLNLQTEDGRAVMHRMARDADVVLMNYRPGVPKRLGVDYETLSAINPRLIVAEVTGFSEPGPLANRASTNIVGEAYSGALALVGKVMPDGSPQGTGLTMADLSTGMGLALGICAALFERDRTGRGQYVHSSLLRGAMAFTGMHNMREPTSDAVALQPVLDEIARVRAAGGTYEEILKVRQGNRDAGGAPYFSGYNVRGGAIVLGALTPATRAATRRTLGIDDDPQDETGFDARSPEGRAALARIRKQTAEILMTRTAAEWIEIFEGAGVPVSVVNLPEDLSDDPQGALEMHPVEHEDFGTQLHVRPIVDFGDTPSSVSRGAPTLGKHTHEVLAEYGYAADEIERLRSDGAVG